MNKVKVFSILLIISFFVFIWSPFVQSVINFKNKITYLEENNFLQKPTISIKYVYNVVQGYEYYLEKSSGLRIFFISLDSFIATNLFHHSPVSSVILGKDGWLFLSEGLINDNGIIPYTDKQLDVIKQKELQTISTLQSKEIYFLSFITPNKSTIYPEYLPSILSGGKRSQRLYQRTNLFSEITTQEVNLTPALLNAKKEHVIYYKTDTHWNNYGGFVAYQEIMKNLVTRFPQLQPLTLSDFTIEEKKKYGGDLAYELGIPYFFTDTDVSFILKPESAKEKLSDTSKLNTLVIYCDSFFCGHSWNITQFLPYHFKHVITKNSNGKFDIDYEFIRKEKPDVVIFELVERNML